MSYYFNKTINGISFDEAIEKVIIELKKEGMGVLTEIDIRKTLKNKIDVDFKKYKILGACNPQFAYKALQNEDKIGILLPCNIIVQEHETGEVEVSVINPVVAMSAVDNKALADIAGKATKAFKHNRRSVNSTYA